MTEKVFVDTNVLVYACDTSAGGKRDRALALLQELWDTNTGRLSTQVLQEFYVTITKKLSNSISLLEARELLHSYGPWVREPNTVSTIMRAVDLSGLAKISFWDALIIASAEQAEATILYSEDMNAGQIIAGVKIVNPFA